jgi:hypothetical protein
MNPAIERLKLIFLGIFAVINVGLLIWQFGWAAPQQKCEAEHRWWDGGLSRVCAQPILISDITGRIIADPKARAQALKAVGREPAPAPASAAKP